MTPEEIAAAGVPPTATTGVTPASTDPAASVTETTNVPGTTTDPKTPLTLEEALDLYRKTDAQLKDRESALTKTRQESIERRKKLDAFEADEKKRLEAAMSEQERKDKQIADSQRERDEARTQLQQVRIDHAVQRQAAKLGFIDTDDAVRFIDRSQLHISDDGTPTNADDLLKDLAASKPYLVRATEAQKPPPAPNTGATNPSRAATGNAGKTLISADQYMDKAYQAAYLTQHGETLMQAAASGKIDFVNMPIRRR